jgi:LacI family transcriptional regulator
LITEGNFSYDSGHHCGQQLLQLADRPTAIFAANDQSAFGVIKAANEMGLSIPADLSVVGFDNIPETAYFPPGGLTTVDQSLRQTGVVATEMLLKIINGAELPGSIHKMPTRLVVRGSCRAL